MRYARRGLHSNTAAKVMRPYFHMLAALRKSLSDSFVINRRFYADLRRRLCNQEILCLRFCTLASSNRSGLDAEVRVHELIGQFSDRSGCDAPALIQNAELTGYAARER